MLELQEIASSISDGKSFMKYYLTMSLKLTLLTKDPPERQPQIKKIKDIYKGTTLHNLKILMFDFLPEKSRQLQVHQVLGKPHWPSTYSQKDKDDI